MTKRKEDFDGDTKIQSKLVRAGDECDRRGCKACFAGKVINIIGGKLIVGFSIEERRYRTREKNRFRRATKNDISDDEGNREIMRWVADRPMGSDSVSPLEG
ncbi:MAG: hypothetical protein ACPG77_12280, partial [Nannocystaceae bacterium]